MAIGVFITPRQAHNQNRYTFSGPVADHVLASRMLGMYVFLSNIRNGSEQRVRNDIDWLSRLVLQKIFLVPSDGLRCRDCRMSVWESLIAPLLSVFLIRYLGGVLGSEDFAYISRRVKLTSPLRANYTCETNRYRHDTYLNGSAEESETPMWTSRICALAHRGQKRRICMVRPQQAIRPVDDRTHHRPKKRVLSTRISIRFRAAPGLRPIAVDGHSE